MSSEAAQKAYPASGSIHDRSGVERSAFDRGAVEALRQAAEAARMIWPDDTAIFLEEMADDWERVVGQ